MARPISTRPTIKICHSNRNWDMVEKLLETVAFQALASSVVPSNCSAPTGRLPRAIGSETIVGLLQGASLAAQVLHLAGGRGTGGIARQAALAASMNSLDQV